MRHVASYRLGLMKKQSMVWLTQTIGQCLGGLMRSHKSCGCEILNKLSGGQGKN